MTIRLAVTIDPSDFRAWMRACQFHNLFQAADALGMKRRQCAAYSSKASPVPLTVQLAMLYVYETGRGAASLSTLPPVQTEPKRFVPVSCPYSGALICKTCGQGYRICDCGEETAPIE